ncbi:MAG: AAA family ATPase [Zoogloeaceae bacterium]|jgi:hypothetical protein|nr:AAA family ATPase [Zoogloeaceae bacterium]
MSESSFSPGIYMTEWELCNLLLNTRLYRALESGASRYPIYRRQRFAARENLQTLFDRMATELGWCAQRPGWNSIILDGPDFLVRGQGSAKTHYCSCFFSIWAGSVASAEDVQKRLLNLVGAARIQEPMFSIDWHFLTAKGELESASIEEMADDALLDEAYPELSGGVTPFIRRYLDAPETVLVLQGAPGTGKTRLIRAILGEISRRNGGDAQALYTGDKKAMESDEIFVRFITGEENAFVVEDADHLLRPRSEGNENLHRFLTLADGVVRAQGRKIVFSTNLPNLGDLDDALIRPGRCFARVQTRHLTAAERDRLLARLCPGDANIRERALRHLPPPSHAGYSLADIYQAFRAETETSGSGTQ